MTLYLSLNGLLLSISATIILILGFMVWLKRNNPGGKLFSWMLFMAFLILVFTTLETTTAEINQKILWSKLRYVGIQSLSPLWFLFSLKFTCQKSIPNRRFRLLLWVIPFLSSILAITNSNHNLIWTHIGIVPENQTLIYRHNWFYWIAIAYEYLLLMVGSFILVRFFQHSPRLFRSQIVAIQVGTIIPWAGSLLYVIGIIPYPGIIIIAVVFILTAITLFIGLVHFQLFDIVPVARGTLVEKMKEGIIVLDAMNRIVDMNLTAKQIFNPAKVGQSIEEILEKWPQLLSRLNSTVEERIEIHLSEKTPHFFDVLVTPLNDRHGNFSGRMILMRDLTMRKELEEDLRKTSQAAEAASKAKSNFLATMSHEIRTPLNAIIGMTSLMLDTELNPEQAGYAETIRASSDALLNLINDILDFSKIEAGKLELEQQSFDLRACVEEALDLTSLRAAEKGLELNYFIEYGTPEFIIGDVTRLRQILVNLLNNAVKFTERGDVMVRLKADRNPPDHTHRFTFHFSVLDTGIGIPGDRIEQIFESFTQTDTSTTRKYGGSGLGLTISKQLSTMMGGKIWAESSGIEGEGSNFNFTIQANQGVERRTSPLPPLYPELEEKNALIVDDNVTTRLILAKYFQSWRMETIAVGTGKQALELLTGDSGSMNHFDIVLVDRTLPDVKAGKLIESIQKQPGLGNLPVFIMSAFGGSQPDKKDPEIFPIISKPIKPALLYDAVCSVLVGQKYMPPRRRSSEIKFDPKLGLKHPLRILLAEDNFTNQQVALRFLNRLGYRADVAANGLEVLSALYRQPYDLIFLDVQMPEMDGLETARQICAEWAADQRPILIAMTAYAMQGDRERCLEAGMTDYISKPVRVSELIRVLSQSSAARDKNQDHSAEKGAGENDLTVQTEEAIHPDSSRVIDFGTLQRLKDSMGDEVIPELISLFLEESQKQMNGIRRGLRDSETELVLISSHSLKSSSALLGAARFSNMCLQIEKLARSRDLATVGKLMSEFENAYQTACTGLKAELQ